MKNYLNKAFTIKDLGAMKYFLGVELSRTAEGIFVSQRKYVLDLLTDAGMTGVKLANIQINLGLNYSEVCGDVLADPNQCRRLMGRLLYLNFT